MKILSRFFDIIFGSMKIDIGPTEPPGVAMIFPEGLKMPVGGVPAAQAIENLQAARRGLGTPLLVEHDESEILIEQIPEVEPMVFRGPSSYDLASMGCSLGVPASIFAAGSPSNADAARLDEHMHQYPRRKLEELDEEIAGSKPSSPGSSPVVTHPIQDESDFTADPVEQKKIELREFRKNYPLDRLGIWAVIVGMEIKFEVPKLLGTCNMTMILCKLTKLEGQPAFLVNGGRGQDIPGDLIQQVADKYVQYLNRESKE